MSRIAIKEAYTDYDSFVQGDICIKSTGPCGGNAGYGGKSSFSIGEYGGGLHQVIVVDGKGDTHVFEDAQNIEVMMCGDDELCFFEKIFNFGAKYFSKFNTRFYKDDSDE